MNNNITRYCIIYAVLSQETGERLNVGLLTFADGKVSLRYSERKLAAMRHLLPAEACDFYEGMLKNMKTEELTDARMDYLHRYSNNLFAVSDLKQVDMPCNEETSQWLYTSNIDSMSTSRNCSTT